MGDPKRLRKKYIPPAHPWNRQAIESERLLVKQYGLRRKKEIFKQNSFLKKYKDIAKRLIADTSAQGKKEREQMMQKLQRQGFISAGAALDDILSLQISHVLARRLQSVVVQKGLARSMAQARQFITHGHIHVGSQSITSPSYLVRVEDIVTFRPTSTLGKEDHPERVPLSVMQVEKKERKKRRAQEKKIEGERHGNKKRRSDH